MLQTGPEKPLRGLRKEAPDHLEQSNTLLALATGTMRAEDRRFALKFLLWLFAGSVFATFLIVLLQGWHLKGFDLPTDFLRWLGAAVIAEVAAILYAVVNFLFKP